MFDKKFSQATAPAIVSASIIDVSRGTAQVSVAEENLGKWYVELPHSPPKKADALKHKNSMKKIFR